MLRTYVSSEHSATAMEPVGRKPTSPMWHRFVWTTTAAMHCGGALRQPTLNWKREIDSVDRPFANMIFVESSSVPTGSDHFLLQDFRDPEN